MIQDYKASIVVKHSLEECKKRIQTFNEGGVLDSNRVEFWSADENTIEYEIKVWRAMNLLGTVSGELLYQDKQSTLVTSQTQLAMRLKIGIVVFTIVAGIITLGEVLSGKFPFGIVAIPWGLLCWVVWTWMCNQVAKSVMKCLQ